LWDAERRADVSILYRTEAWLTLSQLVPAWAKELADRNTSASEVEHDLWRYLYEDTINGLLDAGGPLRNSTRRGVAIIGPDNCARYVEGRLLGRLLVREGKTRSPFFSMPDRILVLKDAVLNFALRRRLPPPSWWAGTTSASKKEALDTPSATKSVRKRGRKPIELQRVKEQMRRDISEGRQTPSSLNDMLEKELSGTYRVSRDTARKARIAVLSECVENSNCDKSSTNDK
jgi:hypothetical protein